MTYHCWCGAWSPGWSFFVRCLHCKVTPLTPLFILCSWKDVTMSNSHFSSRSYIPPLHVELRSTSSFEILLHQRFVYSLPFSYLFNHLIVSGPFSHSHHLAMKIILCIFLAAVSFLYFCSLELCLPFKLCAAKKSICSLKPFFDFLFCLKTFLLLF